MASLVQGIHHITLCPGRPRRIWISTPGPRAASGQADGADGRTIPIYHFYWGSGRADRFIATSFPYGRKRGRPVRGR